jgi:hypothetical protein
VQTSGHAHRHQVTELPPIQPYVIEYRCHKVQCPICGGTTRAALPGEAKGEFGPHLKALIAYLTVVCRIPRRVTESFFEQALNISVSLGSTQNLWQQVSAAVAQLCKELEEQLKQEPVLNSDETGWRSDGKRRYLWALVAQFFVFYIVASTRSTEVLVHLLGAVFKGILCSDRYVAYFKYQKGEAQLCWAHLKRDILGIQDFAKTTEAERFARDALALYALVSHVAQVSEPDHHAGAVGRALDSPAKKLVCPGRKTLGKRGSPGAQPGYGLVRALRPAVYVYRAAGRGADQ